MKTTQEERDLVRQRLAETDSADNFLLRLLDDANELYAQRRPLSRLLELAENPAR